MLGLIAINAVDVISELSLCLKYIKWFLTMRPGCSHITMTCFKNSGQ